MTPDPACAPFSDRHVMLLRWGALFLVFLSLATGLVLVTRHTHFSGPGDQLDYYAQASKFFPFTHNYYGPGYFLALRVVHDILHVEWFTAGRILSWLSTCVYIPLCHILFRRLLDAPLNWLALALVAANPTVISCSYYSLTYAYGATWVVGAIVLTVVAEGRSHGLWLLLGLVFAMAFLTRFQALGFFLGTLAGLLVPSKATSLSGLLRRLGVVVAGFVLPVAAWYLFLEWKQGFIPPNYNFVHLTIALGKFKSFFEVPDLIRQYGSLLGVLRTDGAIVAIGKMAVREALKFPFNVGFELLFVPAGWIVPGLLLTMLKRSSWAPWFLASVSGVVLTGLGSRGWVEYYLPVLPFTIILIGHGVQGLAAGGRSTRLAVAQTVFVLGTTLLWSPAMVWYYFVNHDWPEWSTARAYLQAHATPTDLVSATAGSLPYGASFAFVDRDDIIKPGQDGEFLERLRARGVTYLVLTERHGTEEFPGLNYLLADNLPTLPEGLVREFFITTPKRLAIYRISRQ